MERFFGRIKENKRLALRFDKLTHTFFSFVASNNSQVEGKYPNQLISLVRNTAANLTKIAIPLIAVASLASIPSADAGPLAYAACMAACAAMGPAAPICWGLCAPLLAAPSP